MGGCGGGGEKGTDMFYCVITRARTFICFRCEKGSYKGDHELRPRFHCRPILTIKIMLANTNLVCYARMLVCKNTESGFCAYTHTFGNFFSKSLSTVAYSASSLRRIDSVAAITGEPSSRVRSSSAQRYVGYTCKRWGGGGGESASVGTDKERAKEQRKIPVAPHESGGGEGRKKNGHRQIFFTSLVTAQ